jgi:YD repeat-containing protein
LFVDGVNPFEGNQLPTKLLSAAYYVQREEGEINNPLFFVAFNSNVKFGMTLKDLIEKSVALFCALLLWIYTSMVCADTVTIPSSQVLIGWQTLTSGGPSGSPEGACMASGYIKGGTKFEGLASTANPLEYGCIFGGTVNGIHVTFGGMSNAMPVYQNVCQGGGCSIETGRHKNTGNMCPSTNNPINLGTGNKYASETDFRGGGKFPLELTRYFNNNNASSSKVLLDTYVLTFSASYSGRVAGLPVIALPTPTATSWTTSAAISVLALGVGWRHNYHRAVVQLSNSVATVSRADGKIYAFTLTLGKWVAEGDVMGVLAPLFDSAGAQNGWQYTSPEGEAERFDINGRLVSISSRDGLVQILAYDTQGHLSNVTDNVGRQLSFAYDSSNRLSTMTNAAGGIFTYGYDANNNLISVTYPDGRSKRYLYGEAANVSATPSAGVSYVHALTGIIDENGNRYASYWYDAKGRAFLEEHAPSLNQGIDKHTLAYNTDASGVPTSTVVTDPLGTVRTYNFTTVQGVVKSIGQSQPGGSGCGASSSSLTYDANGNVSSRSDFKGNKTCYAYDLSRNLETVRVEGIAAGSACPTNLAGYTPSTAPGSVERKIGTSWHATYRLPLVIAEPLKITTYTYDAQGNVLSKTERATTDVTGGAGMSAVLTGVPRTTSYTYNGQGQVLTRDGPRTDVTDVTTYTYHPLDASCTGASPLGCRGQLSSVANALNHLITVDGYDANGHILGFTDPNGLTTTFSYDPRGRLLSRNSGGEVTAYTYDGVGNLTQVNLPNGAAYTYTYDQAHRLTDISDATGNRIHYTLDAAGNRIKEETFDSTGTLIRTHSRVFDALNRLWKDIGAVNQTTVYEYDANGNLTSITDPLNRQSTNTYDALNRLISSTDAASGITQYGYDGQDRLISVTDPKSLVTQYQRDGLGNLKQQISPDTGNTGYTYDEAGNFLTRTDAKGQVANYAYDALNRLTGIAYNGGSALQTVAYVYDQGTNGIGHLTQIVDGTGTTAYSYDQHGRLTAEVRQPSPSVSYTTTYGHDAQGRLNSIGYPSGRTVNYSFDGMGRISQISTTFNGATKILASNIAYEPFGGVHSFTYGDGTATPVQTYVRQRDQDGRIASYTLNGKLLAIGYDAASQISFISDPQNLANTANYGYDALSRLTSYTQSALSQGYGYDADGNRVTQTLGSTISNYTYATDSNRLTGIQTGATTQSVTHDANGATTSDATRQYAYDNRGRLIRTTTAQGVINYEVNALGLRVRKQVPYANTDTTYHYDTAGHLIGESATGSAQFTREYIYLGDQPVAVMQ